MLVLMMLVEELVRSATARTLRPHSPNPWLCITIRLYVLLTAPLYHGIDFTEVATELVTKE